MQPGCHVKCYLTNSTTVEGIVEEWSDKVIKLISIEENILIIIHNPEKNIILTRVALQEQELPLQVSKLPTVDTSKFDEAVNLPTSDPNRIKTIANLRNMLTKQEKEIISTNLKYSQTNYQIPKL